MSGRVEKYCMYYSTSQCLKFKCVLPTQEIFAVFKNQNM